MKRIKDGILYLQLEDLVVVWSMVLTAPEIVGKLLQDGLPQTTMVTPDNCNDFFKASEDPECIDFFRKQDWLLDYDEVNSLSCSKLIEARDELKLYYEHEQKQFKDKHKKGAVNPLKGIDYAITQVDNLLKIRLRQS